ncbi:MAG: hypothetical protein ACE5EM_10150 [Sphingomonadales bacterium]
MDEKLEQSVRELTLGNRFKLILILEKAIKEAQEKIERNIAKQSARKKITTGEAADKIEAAQGNRRAQRFPGLPAREKPFVTFTPGDFQEVVDKFNKILEERGFELRISENQLVGGPKALERVIEKIKELDLKVKGPTPFDEKMRNRALPDDRAGLESPLDAAPRAMQVASLDDDEAFRFSGPALSPEALEKLQQIKDTVAAIQTTMRTSLVEPLGMFADQLTETGAVIAGLAERIGADGGAGNPIAGKFEQLNMDLDESFGALRQRITGEFQATLDDLVTRIGVAIEAIPGVCCRCFKPA